MACPCSGSMHGQRMHAPGRHPRVPGPGPPTPLHGTPSTTRSRPAGPSDPWLAAKARGTAECGGLGCWFDSPSDTPPHSACPRQALGTALHTPPLGPATVCGDAWDRADCVRRDMGIWRPSPRGSRVLGRVGRRLLGTVGIPDEVAGGRRTVPDSYTPDRERVPGKAVVVRLLESEGRPRCLHRTEARGEWALHLDRRSTTLVLWGVGDAKGTGTGLLS
jgi:hypothetical protein